MNEQLRRPFSLLILDGLAHNPNPEMNAVVAANTPNLDRLWKEYPYTELITHGLRVGLPEGQMGNSEVGHLNIGGGRIVEQELTRINQAVRDKTLGSNEALKNLLAPVAADSSRALHLFGLASPGGVHSSLEHLQGIILEAINQGAAKIYIHAITDGRDRPPTEAADDLTPLAQWVDQVQNDNSNVEIAVISVCGRFYAMDRDKRWGRTRKAFDLYTQREGERFDDFIGSLRSRYEAEQQDEFLEPIVLKEDTLSRSGAVQDGDALLFFNFRADRMRQIVRAFLGDASGQAGFDNPEVPQNLSIGTLTEYQEGLAVEVLFRPITVDNHFGQVISDAGLKQLRIAETEKYAHVTYFFNGGVEGEWPGEERILIPSPRDVPTYDHKPEMSAFEVADRYIERLKDGDLDVLICNFANCDMVGHTGSIEAATKAVEAVDTCVGRIVEEFLKTDGMMMITADHGNADQMIDYDTEEPHTFHTMHPVPLVLIGNACKSMSLRDGGALCDIAPTALELMGLDVPKEMTGTSLLAGG